VIAGTLLSLSPAAFDALILFAADWFNLDSSFGSSPPEFPPIPLQSWSPLAQQQMINSFFICKKQDNQIENK